MSFIKEEYTDYFKRVGSFSFPDFQLEFNLSYPCARSVIDAYGQKLHYEDGFLYKYVEETDSEEATTTLDESDDELEDEDDDDLSDLDALLEEMKVEMVGYPKKQAMILDYIKEMPEPTPPKVSEPTPTKATPEKEFEPYKGKIRKSGTGCVTMINDHLYEGRFTPRVNGKRISKNVYAKTREECEEKLAELIKTMKVEISQKK